MAFDTHGANGEPWTGFDLDGTLAVYDKWRGVANIGKPVKPMCDLIRKMHDEGKSVKILTARVAPQENGLHHLARVFIARWCRDNLGFVPPITHEKDALMETLYDDRVKAVEQNTGKVLNMAKFKVGDEVRVGNPHHADRGRYGKVVSAGVDGNPLLYDVDLGGGVQLFSESDLVAANSRARNAKFKVGDRVKLIGVSPLRGDFNSGIGKVTKVMERGNGAGYHVLFDDGREFPFVESRLVAANSRNAVVQKALNARWRIIYKNLSGQLFPYGKETYSTREEAEKRVDELRKQGREWGTNASYFVDKVGNSISANADTSVLRETAVNANASRVFKPGEEVRWQYIDGDGDSGVVVADKGSYVEVRLRDGRIEKPSKMLITSNSVRSTNAVVAKALNARAVCNAGDPGHFTSDELSALKGAFAGLNGASFSQYPNKSREQLAVRGGDGILITVQKFAFDGKPVEFDIRGQGPRSGFGVKFASSIREAVTTVKRMLASAKRQSPYSFSKYD